MKRALITGITGQDGSYLCDLLLAAGYAVGGLVNNPSAPPPSGVPIDAAVDVIEGDLLDDASLSAAVERFQPDEIYNLAALSSIGDSYEMPVQSCEVTALGVVRLLEAVRRTNKPIRFFQASSAEMFGDAVTDQQDESTAFAPHSPYGIAKVFAHHMVGCYRRAHGLYACSGILFNHESPRRGPQFVTRKITIAAARIKLGLQEGVALGNIETRRDWGFAGDYVSAIHLMLQQDAPDDYVVATGVTHSIRDLLDAAFGHVGLDWQEYVTIDPRFVRPADTAVLCGNPNRAVERLGWRPSVSFEQLIAMMVDADLAQARAATGDATPAR